MKLVNVCLVLALVACGSKKDKETPAGSGSPAGSSTQPAKPAGSATQPSTSAPDAAAMAGSGSGSGSAGSGSGSAAEAEPPPYTPAADVPDAIKQAIAAEDRSKADRALDAGRKPGEVLAFFKIAPGQKVGELFAGGGATTELLVRITGDKGKVYAQNTKEILDKFARKPWSERAAKPVMKNVVALERPIDDPFPPEVKDLDAVVIFLNYHDTVWMKADRAKMNKAVLGALKKGGVYAIVDHSAAKDSGTKDSETLHRIDEALVKKEVEAAGFKLDGESDLLRNGQDPRDWNASPRQAGEKRGTSDRFTLRFVKP